MKESFDIFSEDPNNPTWIEAVEGLPNTLQRMQKLAAQRRGQYFVFCTLSFNSVCENDAFAIPH